MSEQTSVANRFANGIKVSVEKVLEETESRTYQAANELRNAALLVLRGQRSGRVYKIPGTHSKTANKVTKGLMQDYGRKLSGGQLYRASAPGEPPAVRTGVFRLSWQVQPPRVEKTGNVHRYYASIGSRVKADKSSHLLGDILEHGTKRIAPRPYKKAVVSTALPAIQKIYRAHYKP